MTLVSVFAIFLSLAILPFALRGVTVQRLLLSVGLMVLHAAATVTYFVLAQTTLADTHLYYFGGWYWDRFSWTSLTTVLVGHLTQVLKRSFGATYLDCFMVFQAFGYWGLMMMMRTFQEIFEKVRMPPAPIASILLFVPGLHFWTAAIGKDALMFFGISLCIWSVLNLRRRIPALLIGVTVQLMFRPHIALFTVFALGLAAITHGQFTTGRRMVLLVLAGVAAVIFAATVRTAFNIDLTSPESVGRFLEMRGAAEVADTARSSIANAPFIVRMISLLFRPLFFDAPTLTGIIASCENVGSLLLFGYLIRYWREARLLAKRVFFVRFVMILAILLIILLSVFNYNVGLGLRQRVMAAAPLLSLFVAVWAAQAAQAAGLIHGRPIDRPPVPEAGAPVVRSSP